MSRLHRVRKQLQKRLWSLAEERGLVPAGSTPAGKENGKREMDCDGAIHRVYHYLDGELTVWKRRAISRHLDDCPPCAEGFTFEIELRRGIVSEWREDAPAELKRRIAIALGIVEADDPALE